MSRGWARVGVWMLAALAASAAASATEPAAPGPKKTVAAGHSKPSSFAPQSRPAHRAYGAPIQKPILAKHKRPKRRADKFAPK